MSKVFFLTGSSRGLGRAMAAEILEAGHQLVATARDPSAVADLTHQYGEQVRAVALDVTDPEAVDRAVAEAVEAFDRIDVVINNAGYANVASVEDVTIPDWRAQLDTNLCGVFYVSKAAVPVMREQDGAGSIIQISSVGGRMATAGLSAYHAAKWGVAGFSECLAAEVAPLGIRVTVIEPGGMPTDWAGSSMSIPPISEPYQETVGAMVQLRESGAIGLADLAKVGQVVLQLSDMDEPPLRLMIGSDAFAYGTAAGSRLAESDAQWRSLTSSTDRDDATAAQRDPLGTAG